MKAITYLLFMLLLIPLPKLSAQDIHFSQPSMTPLVQNPALTGGEHDLRAIVNYRNQWNSVASPYKTYNGSFDMKLNQKKDTKGLFACGIGIFSDKAGDSKMGTTLGMLSIAYHLRLDKHSTLGVGITGGFAQRSINYSQLQWTSQYDGTHNASLPSGEPMGDVRSTYIHSGAGVLWHYNKSEGYISGNDLLTATVGIGLFQPHHPNYSFYGTEEQLYTRYVAHGNILAGIKNTNLCIVPGFNFSVQGKAKEFLLGTSFRYITKENSKYTAYSKGAAISLGLYYRSMDAFIPVLSIEFGQYTMGISYDINVSKLKTASSGRGGLELSIRFVSPNPFVYKSASRI